MIIDISFKRIPIKENREMVRDRDVRLTRDLFSMGMYYSIWMGIMSKEEKIDDAKEKEDDCKSKVFESKRGQDPVHNES